MKKLDKIRDSIELDFYGGEISNEDIVKLLQLCEELLQLKTIPTYAKEIGLSPHGVYKCRTNKILKVGGKMFAISND